MRLHSPFCRRSLFMRQATRLLRVIKPYQELSHAHSRALPARALTAVCLATSSSSSRAGTLRQQSRGMTEPAAKRAKMEPTANGSSSSNSPMHTISSPAHGSGSSSPAANAEPHASTASPGRRRRRLLSLSPSREPQDATAADAAGNLEPHANTASPNGSRRRRSVSPSPSREPKAETAAGAGAGAAAGAAAAVTEAPAAVMQAPKAAAAAAAAAKVVDAASNGAEAPTAGAPESPAKAAAGSPRKSPAAPRSPAAAAPSSPRAGSAAAAAAAAPRSPAAGSPQKSPVVAAPRSPAPPAATAAAVQSPAAAGSPAQAAAAAAAAAGAQSPVAAPRSPAAAAAPGSPAAPQQVTPQAAAAAANGIGMPAAARQYSQQHAPPQQQKQQQQQQEMSPQQRQQAQQQQVQQALPLQPAQQQQQQRQESPQHSGKKGRRDKKSRTPFLGSFHQCVKRELPYEAVHIYQKIKQHTGGQLDLGMCNGLLNVAVGNWQWELHQRHQHLLRQAEAQGQDTAPLQAAFKAYVAAERERTWQAAQEEGSPEPADLVVPEGTPQAMVCHIMRAALDRSLPLGDLHNPNTLPDAGVLSDMVAQRKPFTQLLSDVVALVMADVEAAGVQPDDEVLLLGLARVAGIMGDPDKAFSYAQQVVSGANSRVVPRLRDFHPALVGYALAGNADKAGEVIHAMLQHCQPSDLTESEFALWLEAIAGGGSYPQLCEALRLMSVELNELKPRTLELVQRFFESDRAAAALAPGGAVPCGQPSKWQLQWVVPDDSGNVAEAGGSLTLSDLSEADWQLFDKQVFQLGVRGEASPGQFERFRGWLDKHGPFDLTLDGANLAFWGENYSQGGFKAWKIRVAFDHMQQLYPDAKILVVLHQSRVRQTIAADQQTAAWFEELQDKNQMYVTPVNMNDDMFWMYSAIHGGAAARLVSHDLMRDHVWSMLRPKHMLKWKARHTIDYTFSFDKRQFFPQEPLPYTPCVQELRPGVWLLPTVSESDTCPWLLCQPAPVEA